MSKPVTVQTVLGPISSAQLGATLSHEHILASPTGYDSDPNLVFDREGSLITAVEKMRSLKAVGVSTIIDPIPMDLGRQVDFIADVSAASGMNIVCATGLYYETGRMPGFPFYYKMRSVDELTAIYVTELTEGVGPRKIRPGVIKCATSANQVGNSERKALAAAARAAKATGVPITTHTEEGTMGPEQVDIFEAEGLDPRRVTIGHCSDSADLGYLVKVLKRGAYLGFDRVGMEGRTTDDIKIGVVVALVAMGFEKQIVLSHDHAACTHGFNFEIPHGGKRRHTYLHQEFIPRMKAAGITDRTVQTMLVENPRRWFEGG